MLTHSDQTCARSPLIQNISSEKRYHHTVSQVNISAHSGKESSRTSSEEVCLTRPSCTMLPQLHSRTGGCSSQMRDVSVSLISRKSLRPDHFNEEENMSWDRNFSHLLLKYIVVSDTTTTSKYDRDQRRRSRCVTMRSS